MATGARGRSRPGTAVPARRAPAGGSAALAPRRPPGSRRGGAGLAVATRGRRNGWGLGVLFAALLLVVAKLVVLQGVDGGAYANAAEQDRLHSYTIAALRGQILDRHGVPLAYTAQASRVVADPTVIDDPDGTAGALSPLLGLPADELAAKLRQPGRYVVLAPRVDPETVSAIDDLELSGLVFEDNPVRRYPGGSVGGQVIGFVDHAGDGQAGIEATFQEQLAGTPGTRTVEVGSGGHPIPSGIDETTPATDGGTVELTVDADLQYVVQQRLAETCADGATTRGSAVVLDVHTGEVAAMASCPGYDPGDYARTDPGLLGNPIVSEVFEPGSVMKAVTLSAAVEEGLVTPDTVLSVNGHIQAGDRTVTDAHDHAPINWTVTAVLAKSSNVGTIMLAREVGDAKLEGYLRAFGLGSRTGVELPGESAGILEDSTDWTATRAANVPIGQGISVTALQMASVYQTIANGGVRVPPRIVASVTDPDGAVTEQPRPDGTRVISEVTAGQMAYMLEAVVGKGGTAPLGAVEGFRVAGKTGTAQRANPDCGCYEGGGYFTTFVGFAPADDPQYVVAIDLERPTSSAEGGQVAAPVFADLMGFALTAGGIAPSGTPRPDFVFTGTP